MFGYGEGEYRVLGKGTSPVNGGALDALLCELRQSAGSTEPPYIAVFSADGAVDYLFLYADAELAHKDWAKVTGEEPFQYVPNERVSLLVAFSANLNFIECIEAHHTGYTKEGGVAMY